MADLGTFPFGQPVNVVAQTDRSPKRVFVLGVYASAVHARWISPEGKQLIRALAVASEPYIFWRGDGIEPLLDAIRVPEECGQLIPADSKLNGPSGKTLDDSILVPLGLDRSQAWLCDLVPHSCVNAAQNKAIKRAYLPFAQKLALPKPSVPAVPKQLASETRRNEIAAELDESGADTLILLGDQPIQWFLAHYDPRWKLLTDFTRGGQAYGTLHQTRIGHRDIKVLPLAHPRQIAKLGQSSPVWFNRHRTWRDQIAHTIAL